MINDLDHHPHAFVLAALTDRQVDARVAWRLPHKIQERLGSFEIADLGRLDIDDWLRLLQEPTALHRFIRTMAEVLHAGVGRLLSHYGGDASRMWSNNPPSKVVVDRFLEFRGAGPKIATMAANILVRYFHVPMSDYRQIDISADVQVCRVMGRLGFVPEDPSVDTVVRSARSPRSEFPASPTWRRGSSDASVCRATDPSRRSECPHSDLLPSYFRREHMPSKSAVIDEMAMDLEKLAALRDRGLITFAEYESRED